MRPWTLYSSDQDDRLVPNDDLGGGLGDTDRTWAAGWMKQAGGMASHRGSCPNCDIDPAYFMTALLGRYAGNAGVFQCPADKTPYPGSGRTVPYARSVTMNIFMNRTVAVNSPGYAVFRRQADMGKSSDLFVFIHESPEYIEDCIFRLDLGTAGGTFPTWNPPPGTAVGTGQNLFENPPAAIHGGSTTIGFADGHVESHKWNLLGMWNGVPVVANNQTDINWLKSRASQ